ncbi:MAG: hypothetical protein IKX59_10360 [Bacteroidales bacterium]|nr:hypothetical protein [Bacteroidales bacterium]
MRLEQDKYEEWLTTIANTRLIFNTIEELETFLEAPSIHSNGIKRCFTSAQRLRSAFRDLQVEVEQMTDGIINLESVLVQYQKAWTFFRDNLSRRSNPFTVALELLRYSYPPYSEAGLKKRKSDIFEQAHEQDINIPFLVLMLLKVIPGYDSKDGDVIDFSHQYEYAMSLLEKFTEDGELFSTLPAITSAREEPRKSRIMLLYHVKQILHTYASYAKQEDLYDVSRDMKAVQVDLDIKGFWNESDGKPLYTSFWQVEEAINDGTYFITSWHKDAENNITGIRYTMFFYEGLDGNLICYLLHPEAIKHRIKGQPYGDGDQVWYKTEMPTTQKPDTLNFRRLMASSVWPQQINLTRVTDEATISIYRQWLSTCNTVKKFEHLEYEFFPSIFAITHDAIYIATGTEHEYFKVPKSSFEGFARITIDDNVGLMTMNKRQYIVFDEFLLYIPITTNELKKYGITKVDHVE